MSDDEEYEIPLVDQRIFGAGIKRKRVKFVPSTSVSSNATPPSTTSAKSVSDRYLSLVLPKQIPDEEQSAAPSAADYEDEISQVCEICKLPFEEASEQEEPSKPRPHEASLAHQVCLTHSHPPSHLDRSRKGLAYLSAYGWDPDSRLGLGASGQGIQFPIKSKPKDDKLGIGVVVPKGIVKKKKEAKLDAGKVRKMQEADKKKGEMLREMFYRNDDVERYLGGG